MKKSYLKIVLLAVVFVLIGLFYVFDLSNYLSFEYIKSQQQSFSEVYAQNPLLTVVGFCLIYILTTALSIPGATLLTLLAGALFGLGVGFLIVSFSSTIGATLSFLAARFILRDSVQDKFGDKLKVMNDGVKKEGAFYLFSLRLIPIFPFFIINLLMGLTPMKTLTYFIVSQIGMLPGTIVYVNAGTQLGQLESAKGILSPEVLGSFVLLGLLPIVLKKSLAFIKSKKGASNGKV